jgi:hypothetical protein
MGNHAPFPKEKVFAIYAALQTQTDKDIAAQFGIHRTTVGGLRRGTSHPEYLKEYEEAKGHPINSRNKRRKLTDTQVMAILGSDPHYAKPQYARTLRACAQALGINKTTIENIRCGITYKELYIAFHKGRSK